MLSGGIQWHSLSIAFVLGIFLSGAKEGREMLDEMGDGSGGASWLSGGRGTT